MQGTFVAETKLDSRFICVSITYMHAEANLVFITVFFSRINSHEYLYVQNIFPVLFRSCLIPFITVEEDGGDYGMLENKKKTRKSTRIFEIFVGSLDFHMCTVRANEDSLAALPSTRRDRPRAFESR